MPGDDSGTMLSATVNVFGSLSWFASRFLSRTLKGRHHETFHAFIDLDSMGHDALSNMLSSVNHRVSSIDTALGSM